MNIVLSEASSLNPGLIEQLAAIEGINAYLSVSYSDTVRIVREVKPDIIIIDPEENNRNEYSYRLLDLFPDLRIILYDTSREHHFVEMGKDRSLHTISIKKIMSDLSYSFIGNISLNI